MTANTRLLLLRHGESEDNVARRLAGWANSPLSPEGARQAARLAAHVAATERLDALYASPLRRAWETATMIAERTGLTPKPLPDLREWHGGEIEPLTLEEVAERFPGLLQEAQRSRERGDLTFRWPGGESRAEFYERVRRVLGGIVAAHPGEAVAVVAHGGVFDRYLAEQLHRAGPPAAPYVFRHGSVTEVEHVAGQARLVRSDVLAP